MRHAVILAGGAGVRLWPLSRKRRPKQTLQIFEGKSLLRQAYERVAGLLPPEQIHIIANEIHLPLVEEQLPELPKSALIGEPVGRDTANAIGLAAAVLRKNDPQAVMGVFTADHIITPVERFHQDLRKAYEIAERQRDWLVTFGVRPNRADTNYGYIRRGQQIEEDVFEVQKFTEKPSIASAMKYLASGEYYWNSGMFVWQVSTILKELERQLPQTFKSVGEIGDAWGTSSQQHVLSTIYPTLMRISIDFAVMERAERVVAVELGCHWVDVGSWPAIESVIHADGEGNVSACPHVVHLGSRGNIVVSADRHLIATIGVDDLVIVHSPDVTMICTKRDAQGIKELVDNVRHQYGEDYL